VPFKFQMPLPPAPAALTATVSGGQVVLSWGASAGATLYSVQRGTTPGGPYAVIATLTAPGYTDTSATPGVTHYYIVTASVSGVSPETTFLIFSTVCSLSPGLMRSGE